MSYTTSFSDLVNIENSILLLSIVHKFPSQQVRLRATIHAADEYSWFADNSIDNAEVLFAVGMTGLINSFAENEESLSKTLDRIIVKTKEGEEAKRIRFGGVLKRFAPLIINKISSLGMEISPPEEVFQTFIAKKDNKALEGVNFDDVTPLKPEDSLEIAKYWKYGKHMPAPEKYIEYLINKNPSAGIRGENGELGAWGLTQLDFHIGMLHTKEEYRKKGHAKKIVAYLSNQFTKLGLSPHAIISNVNYASISVFSSLGFEPDGVDICWLRSN